MNCTTCDATLTAHETHLYACPYCTRRMTGWLRELAELLPTLRASIIRDTTAPGPRVTLSRSAPGPAREDVLNLLGPSAPAGALEGDDQIGDLPIAETLYRWCRAVWAARDCPRPASTTPEDLAAWLAPHLDWAAEQRWAADMHGDLRAMMRKVRDITRTRPRRRALSQPCPVCDTLALTEIEWQEYRFCSACHGEFTEADLAVGAAAWLARHPEAGAAA